MTKKNLSNNKELLAHFFGKLWNYFLGTITLLLAGMLSILIAWFVIKVVSKSIVDHPIIILPLVLLVFVIIAAISTYKDYNKQVTNKPVKKHKKVQKNGRPKKGINKD